ncbi:Tll0287-like domain-containing protein [Pseudozobellia thermophila]|uniref:Cytochrome c domain-containing protein n=1 Tax=Pseudozobellia thermophila TaxID=192903 RepID=A0A1M6IL63_9FLAO|nr:DUF3365 domain-containing protein [Pseudozobellia thermophila]SHJ35115.1 Protein of unknown function [Pseudozobellia thermophila]
MKNSIIVLVSALLLVNCKESQKDKVDKTDGQEVVERAPTAKVHSGKLLLEKECYICHDPKASMADRIAPPMEAIKRHYIDSNTTKDEFTKALILWVNDPETESKVPTAHAKFGPMPYMPNPDHAVAQIADYLYDNEIERPDWFDEHFEKVHKPGMAVGECGCFGDYDFEQEYAAIGLAYAMEAQAELGKNLKKAIQEKGIVEAIKFCNVEAIPLTDSVSVMNNAIIKRVSDKVRNPKNQANDEELGYIADFKKAIASGKEVSPIVKVNGKEVDFYYPITTNALCLQCHGKPNEQIQPETLATLKNLYPNDKAIGYGANEVRGIWSINFDANN